MYARSLEVHRMAVSKLLTSKEAAVYLGVRQDMLRTLPELPVVIVGQESRYMECDLERWILSRRIVPLFEAKR
jgi:hypothetical protein